MTTWKPIETAPPGVDVLVKGFDLTKPISSYRTMEGEQRVFSSKMEVAHKDNYGWWWCSGGRLYDPTHFAELPE